MQSVDGRPCYLVAYALRREDADRLADAINVVLSEEDRSGRVGSFAPSRPLKAHRDIDPLPALLRVFRWAKEFEILWQGSALPPESLVRDWITSYERNADIEARKMESEAEFQRLRAHAPRTFAEAVDRLADMLAPDDREYLAAMDQGDLVKLHFTYGMWIRNAWLWGNPALVEACGADHPDHASGALISALWRKVRVSE